MPRSKPKNKSKAEKNTATVRYRNNRHPNTRGLLTDLSPYCIDADLIRVVVETPKASRNKFAYEATLGAFALHFVLPQGMEFPFDFGFVPGTKAQDGDPIDVLLVMEESVTQGVVVDVRLIGVIRGMQTEKDGESEENDRLVAVVPSSPLYRNIERLSELPKEALEQIERFFVNYNAERGKRFTLEGMRGPKAAKKCFEKARKRFKRKLGAS